MNATFLRLYMHESRRQHGRLLYEWVLEEARKLGVHGGSGFRAIAGYGRHGVLRDQRFFELAGELPVVVEFVVSATESEQILDLLKRERIDLVYVRWEAEFAVTCEPDSPAVLR